MQRCVRSDKKVSCAGLPFLDRLYSFNALRPRRSGMALKNGASFKLK
jgi:hypothetical protein